MKTDYSLMNAQLKSMIEDIPYPIANLANASAILSENLEDLNWAGFYLMQDNRLVLGPFQGKVACIQIAVGKGVCGTAVAEDEVQRIANVHEFEGHIACDGASNSEIVIPIHKDGKIYGVLDIDSPSFDRFSQEDQEGLEEFVQILEKYGI